MRLKWKGVQIDGMPQLKDNNNKHQDAILFRKLPLKITRAYTHMYIKLDPGRHTIKFHAARFGNYNRGRASPTAALGIPLGRTESVHNDWIIITASEARGL
jgi:hypothetical protein